jgi:hypothetical protein
VIWAIYTAAQAAYDAQVSREQQRVQREMAQREEEGQDIRKRVGATASHRDSVNKVRQSLESLMQSISEQAVAA